MGRDITYSLLPVMVVEHVENDGAAYLDRGPEASEAQLSPEKLKQLPERWKKALVRQFECQLGLRDEWNVPDDDA
jgi:hypothetical protein